MCNLLDVFCAVLQWCISYVASGLTGVHRSVAGSGCLSLRASSVMLFNGGRCIIIVKKEQHCLKFTADITSWSSFLVLHALLFMLVIGRESLGWSLSQLAVRLLIELLRLLLAPPMIVIGSESSLGWSLSQLAVRLLIELLRLLLAPPSLGLERISGMKELIPQAGLLFGEDIICE